MSRDEPEGKLRSLLERLEDEIPEIGPSDVSTPSSQWPSLLGTAAVLALAVALVGVIARGGFGDPGTSPPASATTSATSPAPSASVIGPSPTNFPTPSPPRGNLAVAWSPVEFPGGAVRAAFGAAEGWAALNERGAWWSVDSITWLPGSLGDVSVPPPHDQLADWSTPRPVAITRMGSTWYGLALWDGPSGDTYPLVYTSSDGRNWVQLPSSDWWGDITESLASNGSLLIAANHTLGAGAGSVFTSADGILWSELVAPGGPASILDVVADAERIVAVGYRVSASGVQVPAVWWSEDGATWFDAELPGVEDRTVAWSIARSADGIYVLVTTTRPAPSEGCGELACRPANVGAWYSTDGRVWYRADFPAAEVDEIRSLKAWLIAPAAGGMLAGGTTRDGLASWVSGDGIHWTTLALPATSSTEFTGSANYGDEAVFFLTGADQTDVLRGTVTREP